MMFRPNILKLLHDDSHLCIDKCFQRAKGSVYCQSITEDIRHLVNKCSKCLVNCRWNQKEPNVPFDIPIIAWKTITSNLFTFDSKSYLLVIDLSCCFPAVRLLPNETSKLVLQCMKLMFTNFGIPEIIISDSGPCFKSSEFQDFCQKFDIVHQAGSAFNHQANSIAERAIQTVNI